jgi:regulatory protein
MKITSIELSGKSKDMKRVFLDGTYAFSIPEVDFIKLKLYEEDEVSEDLLERIKGVILLHLAKEKAVRILTAHDRTAAELSQRLHDAGYDKEIYDAAIQDLKTIGYVNDIRFAQRYIAEKIQTKAVSRKLLRYELIAKGITEDTIDHVLSELEQDEDEIALRSVRKKFGKYDVSDPSVQKKIYAFLNHRGYSYDLCRSILSDLLNVEENS